MKGKLIIVVLFIILVFSPLISAAEKKDIPGARFENISLVDFIKFISAKTGQSILYSSSTIPSSIKVTLYSPSALSNEDLMKIFYSVLKENRLIPIKEGKSIFIIKATNIKNVGSKYTSNISSQPSTLATTIIKLKNISVDKLHVTLRHLVSPYGSLDIVPTLNAVVITDTKDRIRQIEKFMHSLDSSSKITTKLIPIKNASSSRVASELNKFFAELRSKKGISYSPVVLSEDTTNSLIIAARKSDFSYIQDLIDEIVGKASIQKSQKVFYLKNATAKNVYSVITKILSKTPSFRKTSISYDEATNSIIVIGSPSACDKVSSLIKQLDVPRKEVYIEALIIETSLSNLSEFGVEWTALGKHKGSIGYIGNANKGNLGNIENSVINNGQLTSLPNGFSMGILGDTVTYNGVKFPTLGALLNAIKSNNKINIVSNPKIVTLDNQKATIFVGENRPYLTSQKYDNNGNPIYTYDYKDVGVKLDILPHVNSDKIILDATLNVKKVTENVVVGNSVAPVTLTRTTTTKIALADGDKIMISGLIENDKEQKKEDVPILSSIPLLGGLFSYKKDSSNKTNLVIFLSVKIINSQEEMEKFLRKNEKKGEKS